jgi:protein-tyrosine phosphatase
MSETRTRHIQVDGLYNLRDIGGYRSGSQHTKWQTLYRSDALHRITPTGLNRFSALNVGTVLDLRDDTERAYSPSLLPQDVQIIASPIMQSIGDTLTTSGISIHSLYQNLLENYAANYVRGIRYVLNNAHAPVLVHCTAGKDRTGTFVALVLLAIDVDREDVLHDYAQTENLLAGEWAQQHLSVMRSTGLDITPELHTLLVQSPSEALDSALARLEQRFGSVGDYLRAHGLSDAERDALADMLLEGADTSGE